MRAAIELGLSFTTAVHNEIAIVLQQKSMRVYATKFLYLALRPVRLLQWFTITLWNVVCRAITQDSIQRQMDLHSLAGYYCVLTRKR